MLKNLTLLGLAMLLLAMPAVARADDDDDDDAAQVAGQSEDCQVHKGFAGLLSNRQKLEPLTIASGKPLSKEPYNLKTGCYYTLDVISDGSIEQGVEGNSFFRNVWINEVVVNQIEIRPMGMSSIEFDRSGTASISFVTIKPGKMVLHMEGRTGDDQSAVFNVTP